MVSWEYGTGKLIEKIKIRDYDHHQAVIIESGWSKLLMGTSGGIIHHSANGGAKAEI